MKKEAIICDVCENFLAETKCDVCGKDVCEKCHKETNIGFIDYNFCSSCSKAVIKMNTENFLGDIFKDKTELKKEIAEILKNAIMLFEIEEKKEKPKEPLFTPFKPITFPSYPPPPSPYPNPWPKPKKPRYPMYPYKTYRITENKNIYKVPQTTGREVN